jgi:signal transduction histidine kinase
MLKRLTTRLVLSQLLVISVAMALLTFILLSLVQNYFVQAAQDSLLIQARLAAQALALPNGATASANVTQSQLPSAANSVQNSQLPAQAAAQNLSAVNTSNVRLSMDLETRVRVLDRHAVVQSDSAAPLPSEQSAGPAGEPDLTAITAALAGNERSWVDADTVFTAVPLRRGETVIGAVLLSQPLRDVSNVMADLRLRLLISAAVALALAALVGVILARGIARPVRELTTAANELARGDFDYPLAVTSQDELGDLARAFRSMSDDLQRMLQARTDLVANVSHELRTPLTAVKGLVETLRAGAADDPAVRDTFLASIEQQTDRLTRLVNDLLILSRADSNALTLRPRPLSVLALARATAAQIAPRAAAGRVTIRVEGEEIEAPADPDRIQQVLINLLDNAIRFSPPGGTVAICVVPATGAVKVSVSDEGAGIAPAEQARVFERFYRGDKSRARNADAQQGAGLGLSIAQALVHAHGGQIGVDSAPGQGATVWFTLPLRLPEPQMPETERRTLTSPQSR